MEEKYRIVACQSFLPVISLEFISLGGSSLLLAGEGPHLKLFLQEKQLQCLDDVLPFNRVHGIRQCPPVAYMHKDHCPIVVFGQKEFRLVNLRLEDKQFRLCCTSKVFKSFDWILDVCWLSFQDASNFTVSFITAHNAVSVYRMTGGAVDMTVVHNETNCILYSAHLLRDPSDNLTVASGTVFNQILLWTVPLHSALSERMVVRLRLIGHEGVIFSVRMSEDRRQLVSVSDDRTIRVWGLPPDWMSLERVEHCDCSLVLYGHTARVWDARLLPTVIVSVGEDATCKLWDYSGRCLNTVGGHSGRSIWSMAVSADNTVVATGGGDCSIRLHRLDHQFGLGEWKFDSCLPATAAKASIKDVPRSVCICGKTALCLTNNGILYAAVLSEADTEAASSTFASKWTERSRDSRFSGYCVIALSDALSVLALGNLQGYIKLLQLNEEGNVLQEMLWKAHYGKVFSLNWTAMSNGSHFSSHLFSCGPDGRVICWQCDTTKKALNITLMAAFILPPSKHRWISALLTLHNAISLKAPDKLPEGVRKELESGDYIFILGDRKGSLHVYKSPLRPMTMDRLCQSPSAIVFTAPTRSYPVHGPNGVTSIEHHNGLVVSAGRNGYCIKYALCGDGSLSELTRFKPVKGMDWIEELMFVEEDLLVLGFHTTDMVLYSTDQNKHVLRIDCGGGHRSYGVNTKQKMLHTKLMHTVFIKQSLLCIRRASLVSYFDAPIIQQAFVGREAASLEIIEGNSDTGDLLMAVGSEDCTVCLVAASSLRSTLRVLKTLNGHLSCVKALNSSSSCLEKGSKILFTGGARASLKAWSIPHIQSLTANSEDVIFAGEVFLHEKPTTRRQKLKLKDSGSAHLPECRVMSLVSFPLEPFDYHVRRELKSAPCCSHYVVAGCSDGSLRQFMYSETTSQFHPQVSLEYHDRCVLCLKSFRLPIPSSPECISSTPSFLCSSATDGCVVIWNIAPTIREWLVASDSIVVASDSIELSYKGDDDTGEYRSTEGLPTHSLAPVLVFKSHQSGINDIAIYCKGERCSIASVGDDNALTVTILSLVTGPYPLFTVDTQLSNLSAHSSSITGVQFLHDDLLISTSIDQRLNMWRINDLKTLTLMQCFTHDVADVACLKAFQHCDCTTVVLCGVGLQYYCICSGINTPGSSSTL